MGIESKAEGERENGIEGERERGKRWKEKGWENDRQIEIERKGEG